MKSIIAHVWSNGDPSIGVCGGSSDVDTNLGEFKDKNHREFVREQLENCFSKIWEDKAKVIFMDEQDILESS